jgi:mono/diheme cytochrome c family protein
VRLQFALTASAMGTPEADAALVRIFQQDDEQTAYVRDAVITGMRGRELPFLQQLLASPQWEQGSRGRAALLTGLAKSIVGEASPKRVNALLELIADQSASQSWRQLAMLDGFPDPPSDKRSRRPKAVMLDTEPKWLAPMQELGEPVGKRLEKVTSLVHWPGQPGYEPPAPPEPLTPQQQARFEAGRKIFSVTCAACHNIDGRGRSGLAPPLLDSEWVLGPDTRLGRIVLHGVRGPITVAGGTYNLEMPALPTLNDEDIAAVLTYVRREWDHTAPAVEPESIARIRREDANRSGAWTERELLRIR